MILGPGGERGLESVADLVESQDRVGDKKAHEWGQHIDLLEQAEGECHEEQDDELTDQGGIGPGQQGLLDPLATADVIRP